MHHLHPGRWMARAAALALVLSAASAHAQTVMLTQYQPAAPGGLNIQAQYDLGSLVTATPALDPATVRWIQEISLTDGSGNPKTTVTGYPNAIFIDPQPTQPPGGWDNLPWYDVTYNSAADRTTDTNRQNGAGAFYNDSPSGWAPFKPITFSADTAVVTINTTDNTFRFLGGFTWGFSVDAAGNYAAQGFASTIDTSANRAIFNNALAVGPATFSAWSMVSNTNGAQRLTFINGTPEPSAAVFLGAGMIAAGFGRRARRLRRKSA